MGFIIGLLTFFLVVDCVVLVFLVLIQLPKKEAGAGLAFGGAASDALFGAGSGNVLTKITKYTAGIFFVMAIVLSAIQSHRGHAGSKFLQNVSRESTAPVPTLPASPAPAPGATASTVPSSNQTLVPPGIPSIPATNLPGAPGNATNITSPPPSK